jgi:hypothetical protein
MRARCLTIAWFLLMSGCSDPSSEHGSSGQNGGAGGSSGSTWMAGTGGSSGFNASGGSTSLGGSGGTSSESGPPAPVGTECNDLVADVPDYLIVGADGAPPAATGGVITDGTYYLEVQSVFGLPASLSLDAGSVKVVIAGNSWQEVDGVPADEVDVNPVQHASATISTSGTSLTLSGWCPAAAQSERDDVLTFSADASGFKLYGVDHGDPWEAVFVPK